jgi:Flp pilus assembly pilin Flp
MTNVQRFRKDRKGTAVVEYALLLFAVLLVGGATQRIVGGRVSDGASQAAILLGGNGAGGGGGAGAGANGAGGGNGGGKNGGGFSCDAQGTADLKNAIAEDKQDVANAATQEDRLQAEFRQKAHETQLASCNAAAQL